MHFAAPLPLWLVALVLALIGGIAWFAYRRPAAPLSPSRRALLVVLRVASLTILLVLVCRPVFLIPARQEDVVVPVLVDVSRSMRVADVDGETRIDGARRVLQTMLPGLAERFTAELYTVGDGVKPQTASDIGSWSPSARRSDLVSAVAAIRDRYRGRRIAGIVLVSDGGDTTPVQSNARVEDIPVFAVGVGQASGVADREVTGLTAGEQALDQASVDLQASVVSRGLGRAPLEVVVRGNGQIVATRRVELPADGSPAEARFTVVPDSTSPTVFTVDVAGASAESIPENNARSVMVSPPGRKRRLLFLAGAPGFDHSFLARALSEDPGFEVDTVVRKGKNDDGRDTFVVQAGGARGPKLAQGLPGRKEDLFAYDGLIIANVEADFFSRAQMELVAEFVGVRGGGLLLLGGRSFAQRGLMGTALEDVLPVDLTDRRSDAARGSFGAERPGRLHAVSLTPEGMQHPVMRIAATADETVQRWTALPPLASSAPLGNPRPGASVLAVAAEPAGMTPLVAVQRYGRGRSMVFGGEASWRWRMLMPATDHSYEFFWRQSARWLAASAPDPVSVTVTEAAEPGDMASIHIDARNAAFGSVPDATVQAAVTTPDGERRVLTLRQSEGGFEASTMVEQPGVYRVQAEARQGETALGTADRWFYVGGVDRELADPRLNDGVLRRMARASGGRYVPATEASSVARWLSDAVPQTTEPEQRDLWHRPWIYIVMIGLLATEWVLRRRWGLR